MNLTRWKMLAAGFGISVCGLAALAEPACRTIGHSAGRSDPTVPESKPKGATEPKATPVSAPTPVELPAPIPPIPEAKPTNPLTLKEAIAIATEQGNSVPKPAVGVTTPAEIAQPVALPDLKPGLPPETQLPSVSQLLPIPTPVPTAPVFIGPIVTVEQLDPNFAKPLTPPIPGPVTLLPMSVAPPEVLTPPVPPITQVNSVVPSDKKLRVTLQMDEGNPKFEVRDGEEVVLKVVSDKVDVTSPKNKGERWSALKAMGQVKFMTPGGDGFCDELHVVPGTGEVIAVGHVKFTYNWGKVETSATAEKMNFRLGAQQSPVK